MIWIDLVENRCSRFSMRRVVRGSSFLCRRARRPAFPLSTPNEPRRHECLERGFSPGSERAYKTLGSRDCRPPVAIERRQTRTTVRRRTPPSRPAQADTAFAYPQADRDQFRTNRVLLLGVVAILCS